MDNLRGHVVVITGASSGFGRGAALKYAEAGANLVLAARRKSVLNNVARQCEETGVRAVPVEADVSDPRDVQRLASRAVKEFGRIDVWINNAGVGTFGRFEDIPLDEHEQLIRTNLLGTIYGSHAALREFRKRDRGILINMASFAGQVAGPYHASYAASKFGIRGLSTAIRQELDQNGEANIRVCTVMPVSFDTPFFEHAGNHQGKPVKPIPPVYDPQRVIDTLLNLAIEPRDEVAVGTFGKMGVLGHKVAPSLLEKQLAKQTHKAEMEQEESAPPSSGSVFKPMSSGTDVYGGWLEQKSGNTTRNLLMIAVPVAVGIGLMARRRQNQGRGESRAA